MISQNGIKRAGRIQARQNKPEKLELTVKHWPALYRESYYSLDPRLYPDEKTLREWAKERFGWGRLRKIGEHRYVYLRDVRAPLLRRIGAFLLNKSYK